MKTWTQIFVFFFCISSGAIRSSVLDSLKSALITATKPGTKTHDTTLANLLSALIDEAPDEEWPAYNEQLFTHLESAYSKKKISQHFYDKNMSAVISNRGFYAQQHGDLKRALDCYHASLRLSEKIKDDFGIATALNNIGVIFFDEGEVDKALEYYFRSYEIQKIQGNQGELVFVLSNIAGIYDRKRNPEKAFDYYFKTLKILETSGDQRQKASTINNIGYLYERYGSPDCLLEKGACLEEGKKKARACYFESLEIREKLGHKDGVTFSLLSLARLYLNEGKAAEAKVFAERGMQIANEIGFTESIRNAANLLYVIYKKESNHHKAFEMYTLYIQMRDSLNNQETKRTALKKELQYEYDTRATRDSIKAMEEKKLAQIELKKIESARYLLFGGLVTISVFALFMVNRFRVANRQKKQIEEQKRISELQKRVVEEKQKEVLDSIHYAKKIQQALLTSERYIKKNLRELNR